MTDATNTPTHTSYDRHLRDATPKYLNQKRLYADAAIRRRTIANNQWPPGGRVMPMLSHNMARYNASFADLENEEQAHELEEADAMMFQDRTRRLPQAPYR